MTTPKTDAIMALADRYAFHIPGSQHSDEARAVLLAALQEQAREGEAVAPSAILARGRFHAFKGENGEPDDWEWFEEGTNCEHGCIDAVIVRADAIAAPQPAQESIECDCGRIHKKTSYGWVSSEPAQPVALPLTQEELDLCRQWFNFLQDTNAEYLEPSDYLLAEKVYKQLNMRVPNSISEITKSGIGGGK